jgi:hypothetical protein
MKRIWITLLFSLGMLTLAACATAAASPASAPSPDTAAETPFTLDQLVATDPGTVQLAAGKVQLVEFFASW